MIGQETIEARIHSRTFPGLPAGKAVLPDYDGYSICKIPALIRSLYEPGSEQGKPLREALGGVCPSGVNKVVLFILDGVGFYHLRELLDRFPDLYLRQLAEQGALLPITSVFPPTTVSALSTFCTGRTPQEHGMVGYRLYLKEISAVANMIRLATVGNPRSDSAVDAGLDLPTFLGLPTVYEQLRTLDVQTHVLLTRRIATSGMSQLLYRGATQLHSVIDFADMLVAARRVLQVAQGNVFVTLYWGGTDAVAHTYGPFTEEFDAEFYAVDAALRRELDGRVEDTLFLLTSDHGFVAMEAEDYLRFPETMRRQHLVRLPLGEPRASYLYVREGQMRTVAESMAERFDSSLICMDSRAALSMGLFGEGDVKPEVPDRIGDLLVASTDQAALFHPYPDATLLKGMHGGLTAQEMVVPLLASWF